MRFRKEIGNVPAASAVGSSVAEGEAVFGHGGDHRQRFDADAFGAEFVSAALKSFFYGYSGACKYNAYGGIANNNKIAGDWHRISSIKYPSIHVNQFDGTTANSFKPEGEPNHMADARTMMDNAAPYFFRHSENINVCFTDGHAEAFGINKIKNKHPSYGWPYFLTDLYWYPNAPCPGGDQR